MLCRFHLASWTEHPHVGMSFLELCEVPDVFDLTAVRWKDNPGCLELGECLQWRTVMLSHVSCATGDVMMFDCLT